MRMRTRRKLRLLFTAACALALSGCVELLDHHARREHAASSSLVNFLYGERAVPVNDAQAQLRLPIRVGVSFLPPPADSFGTQPSAIQRARVLDAIRENFRALPYVSDIVVVPDYYLQSAAGDGLTRIEQISQMQRLDLYALVSYDQITDTSMNNRSLAYFTIVGAYFVRGDRHETNTLLDLAVVDPKSRSLVLRAGGTSRLAGNTTAIDMARHETNQRSKGFELATQSLVDNFRGELTAFEARVKDGSAPVRVVKSPAPGGGAGAFDALFLAGLLLLSAAAAMRRGKKWRPDLEWGQAPFSMTKMEPVPIVRHCDSRVALNLIFGQRSIVRSRFTRDGAR